MYIFFFQAEDGIRDGTVTGVQTCALPICCPDRRRLAGAPVPEGGERVRRAPLLLALAAGSVLGGAPARAQIAPAPPAAAAPPAGAPEAGFVEEKIRIPIFGRVKV